MAHAVDSRPGSSYKQVACSYQHAPDEYQLGIEIQIQCNIDYLLYEYFINSLCVILSIGKELWRREFKGEENDKEEKYEYQF